MAVSQAHDDDGNGRMHRLSFMLAMHQYKRLKVVAASEGRTVTDILRQILVEFLNKYDELFAREQD